MPDYEVSTKDQHEGAFSFHTYLDSSRSSITSKDNQAATKLSELGESVQLRRLRYIAPKVIDLRDKLFRSRLRLREKRVELREEREIVGRLDSRLMSSLRKYWHQGFLFEQSAFEKIFTELEVKRDEVGALQYEYDQAEDEHEMIEVDLEKEERLLSLSYNPAIDREDHEELDTDSVSIQTTKSLDQPSYPSESSLSEALHARYQSRLGDARIISERIQDRYIDLDKRENRVAGVIGSDHRLKDTASLRESKLAITEAEDELRIIEIDLDDIKKSLQEDPTAILQTPVLKESQTPVYGQISPKQDIINHHPPVYYVDKGLGEVQRGCQDDQSCWILELFKSSSVYQAHRKAIGQADQSNYLADRIWLRFVLLRYNEFGKTASFGFEESTKFQRLSDKERWIRIIRILVLDPSGVSAVVHEYDKRFPSTGARHRKISRSAYKTGGVPYEDGNLDLDLISECEARSV